MSRFFAPGQYFKSITCGVNFEHYFVDEVQVFYNGLLKVTGWSRVPVGQLPNPMLKVDGTVMEPSTRFITARPDVAAATGLPQLSGFVFEFLIVRPQIATPFDVKSVEVSMANRRLLSLEHLSFQRPDFFELLTTDSVASRDSIYRSAEHPPLQVSEEILSVVRSLPAPILDFGCGSGVLVRALRREGKEIFGVDLDIPWIREHTLEEAKPYVSFYDGSDRLPFADGHFASVVCSEVLEHIPHYQKIVPELARVAKDCVLVTVPNSAAIPVLFHEYAVPWHMLERDHVNFFTQRSLDAALAPHFGRVDHFRMHEKVINSTRYFVGLGALCYGPRR
jgi:SAM-dependent methyltransferase